MEILEKILGELSKIKKCQNSSNQDYRIGYISALSVAEGIIAENINGSEDAGYERNQAVIEILNGLSDWWYTEAPVHNDEPENLTFKVLNEVYKFIETYLDEPKEQKIEKKKTCSECQWHLINGGSCEKNTGCWQYVDIRRDDDFNFNEMIKVIADHYGWQEQHRNAIEEMSELIKAICKKERKQDSSTEERREIIDEIADVKIMLAQIEYLLSAENEVEEVIKQKVKRQLWRMKNE